MLNGRMFLLVAKYGRLIRTTTRRGTSKRGYVKRIDIHSLKKTTLISLHFVPVEIPEFMTEEEVEDIKARAEDDGLFESRAKGGLTEPDFFKPSGSK